MDISAEAMKENKTQEGSQDVAETHYNVGFYVFSPHEGNPLSQVKVNRSLTPEFSRDHHTAVSEYYSLKYVGSAIFTKSLCHLQKVSS